MGELKTLNEAADYLRSSPKTLRWWRAKNLGPTSFVLGRHVMYRQSDLESWIREQVDATKRGGQPG
ncbi:helix-turn-helix domain-containing protein [Jatrophihabitans telluris]|uniref:Helix-turn-helix domain-containing protein n=1 Tax=Jatrophihabitans telluris TaxID=2038343 RepID=A0ABY4R221_9ACTN|nr:helix-turn-helix domain-containing protein [Jatrophihabitans telluris]UQX89206.1 helix-turn-helix domain-containing protein [Jatrophihabitans telluris]